MQKTLLPTLLVFVSIQVMAHYSERAEFALNGPVESVTTRNFSADCYNASDFQITDSSRFTHKTVRFFNKDGMVEWYSSLSQVHDPTGVNTLVYATFISYAFDASGKKSAAFARSRQTRAGSLISTNETHYSYYWEDAYHYTESVHDSSRTHLISRFHYTLDSSFFILNERHEYYWKNRDTADATYEASYSKNYKGQIASCHALYNTNKNPFASTYDYKAFDAYGNPTVYILHVQTQDASFDQLVLKTYTYFED